MRLRSLPIVLVVAALVAACSAGPGQGGELEGTDWVLRSYEQDGALTLVPETQYADASFFAQRVRGFSGCNQFDARYRAGGRTLLISSRAATTVMACPEEDMTFEQTYLGLLSESRFYSARRDTLTIYDGSATTILVFDAAPRNPLRGDWRVDSFASAPNTVTAVLEGTELEVIFGLASVGGFAGCNSFSGTYGTNGNVVRVGRLATTRKACEQDVMDQETAFLEALQGAALVESRGDRLNLTDLSGSIVVAFIRPWAIEAPAPSPSPAPAPSESVEPSPSATATPTPKPSATPKPTPTPAPSPKPTASAAPTAAPSLTPPPVIPTVEVCDLRTSNGTTLAAMTYPGTWFTLAEPADLACRYFDPAEITVPADPTTLVTAVQATIEPTPFADAVSAATDPAVWEVGHREDLTISNLQATLVEATAITSSGGIVAGTSRFAYFIDVRSAGTLVIFTLGAEGDEAYADHAAVTTMMTALSVIQAPS
jgi:heat shock protein HslJ